MARLLLVLETLLSLAYPFGLHLAVTFGQTRLAAVSLLAVAALLVLLSSLARRSRSAILVRVGVLALTAALAVLSFRIHSERLLQSYPLLVNAALFVTFASSLHRERTLVESFARLHRPDLSAPEVLHCRRATQAWSAFFLANAGVVAVLIFFAPLGVWTLYTGVVSYLLSLLVGITELVVRVRRFGPASAGIVGQHLLPLLRPLLGGADGRAVD